MGTAEEIWIMWKRNPGYLKGWRCRIKSQTGQMMRIMV
jgi:hypothetical protein